MNVSDSAEVYERGIAVRDEMLGSEHGRAKVETQGEFTRDFEEMVTRYCFGEVWTRDQLPRAQRSMITIAMLIALGRAHEIRVHVKGALTNGVTKEQISEIIMHSAIYCGVPAAVDAYRNASAMLEELGLGMSGSPQGLHVGFVGLGNMGGPMVRNLAAAGFALTVRDANDALQAQIAAEVGAAGAASSSDFADVDVVVTMLPDDRAVSAVMLEWDGGIASALRPGAVLVDMSSSNPNGTITLGKALAERGVGFVDSPVSGGIARAVTGTLALMAGTDDPAHLERVRPVLEVLGGQIFPTGPLGSGHAMKALNNFVGGTTYVVTAEALAIGQHYGLTPSTMVDVFNASTARSFNSEVVFKEHVISGKYATGVRARADHEGRRHRRRPRGGERGRRAARPALERALGGVRREAGIRCRPLRGPQGVVAGRPRRSRR